MINTKTFNWTAGASGAVADMEVDDLFLSGGYGYSLHSMATVPGSPAPTDNYDITIEDVDGIDVLGGAGMNRDTANAERVMPLYGSTPHPTPINGKLTIKIANNAVNGAKGLIKLYFVRMAASY
jgi:hypothetical protein